MENLKLILPEILISISIMFFLILGVFKKNSSKLIYNLSIITLIILLVLIYNFNSVPDSYMFKDSFVIDKMSTFMKFLLIGSGIFVMLTSSKYIQISKINKIEYPILILSSILGMMIMNMAQDLLKVLH